MVECENEMRTGEQIGPPRTQSLGSRSVRRGHNRLGAGRANIKALNLLAQDLASFGAAPHTTWPQTADERDAE